MVCFSSHQTNSAAVGDVQTNELTVIKGIGTWGSGQAAFKHTKGISVLKCDMSGIETVVLTLFLGEIKQN